MLPKYASCVHCSICDDDYYCDYGCDNDHYRGNDYSDNDYSDDDDDYHYCDDN